MDGAAGVTVMARCCLGVGGTWWLGRAGRHGGVRGWRKVLGCRLDYGGVVAWARESCGGDDGSSRG